MKKAIHHFLVTHGTDLDVDGKDSLPPYLWASPYILMQKANENEAVVKKKKKKKLWLKKKIRFKFTSYLYL